MLLCHEKYNMIHRGKHENILLNMCFLHLYLSPDEVYQYRGISHNIAIQIFSVVSHNVVRYRYVLYDSHI